MTDEDRRMLALFMIFVMGVVCASARGLTANMGLNDARLDLERLLREWGKV